MAAEYFEYKDEDAFQESFKRIGDFRREMVFSDVAITSEDNREFHCHKVILASASPYFRAMFLADMKESQQNKIQIKGVESTALEQLLEFCYTSSITINSDNVQNLLIATGMLQFPKIQESCMEYLVNNLDETNCIGIWKLAEIFQKSHPAFAKLKSYIKSNFSFVTKHDEFLDLTIEQFLEFVSSEDLNVPMENDLCSAVIRWVRFDPQQRAAHLPALMSNVRFFLVTRRHLMDVVVNEELVMEDRICRQFIYDAIRYHLVPESRVNEKSKKTLHSDRKAREKNTRFLYLLGGEECGSVVSNVECFDSSIQTWHDVSPMIVARKFVATAVLDSQLYAVGGINDQYGDLVTAELCNLATNQWNSMASMEECKGAVAIAVLDGWLYAAGGSHNGAALKTVERYDSHQNTWFLIPNMNLPRSHFGLEPLGGKLYAIAGYCGTCAIPHVENYDPLANTWTEVASLNKPRMNHGTVSYAGKIYVVGGASSCGVLNSIEIFDPEVNHWSFVRNRLNPRSGACLTVVRTSQDSEAQLWIVGGHDHKNRDFKTALTLSMCDLSFQGEVPLPRTCVFGGHASV